MPQPQAAPAPSYYPPPKKPVPGLVYVGAILLLVAGLVAGWSSRQQAPPAAGPALVPSPFAAESPTPIETRKLSAIATSSAFLSLDKAVSDLITTVNGVNLDDTAVSPPVVELSLGFSN